MNMINFMLSCVEHEKSFIPSGPVQNCKEFIVCTISPAAVIAKLIEKKMLSLVYMHNLHPGANLHTGVKLHPGVNLHPPNVPFIYQ